MPQQSALEYIRSGQTPFFRLPCADPHGLTGVDAALIGVTFDAGTTYQPGTRLAPYHLRRVSALLQPVHPVQGLDVFERVRTVDAGNVAFPPFEPGVYHPLEREVWTYPMRIQGASLPKWFVVQLSLDDHTVRETYLMDDPNFTAKDGCCRRH